MENFSIEVPPLEGKDDHQMITLVESTDMDDNGILDNRASPPLVHVLEAVPFGSNLPSTTTPMESSPQCLICNAKLGVSGRGSMDIFSKQVKTSSRQMDLDAALGSIVNRELSASEVHSTIICKKCFRLIDDIDCVEAQLLNMKEELTTKYSRTLALLKHESNAIFLEDDNYDPEGITALAKDDREYRIYSSKKVRQKKRRRGRGRPPSYLELEVKEEVEEGDLQTLELSDPSQMLQQDPLRGNTTDPQDFLTQLNYEGEDNNFPNDCDFTLVDGLDLRKDESSIQFGSMILDSLADEDMKPTSEVSPTPASSVEGKFKCRFCQLKIGTFADVEKHLLEFHADRLNECEVCEKQLLSHSHLLEHIEEHISSGEKPYACNLCQQRFALPRQLREHLKQHGGRPCYHCSKRFRSEAALREHMNIHTGNRPYACDKCNKKFTSKHILKTHMKTHGVRARPHKCKVCQKHFLTAYHLQDHVQIHQNRKDFICGTCGKAFGTQRSLDLHSLMHTGIKNYACRICHKAFARKGEVEDHERIHTGERPFQCEICGATFSQRSNLLSHKKATHFEEKKYQCTDCPKAFKRRRLLVYHMMSVHTGERPFKCEICSAAFVYPEHYKKHLRIHTGEKPFKCEICGKAFNSRDNKNAHKFIHSDKKQYECMLCGAGFMRKPLLANHIAQHQQSATIDNMDAYVKVNPPSIVDAELLENTILSGSNIMKIDEVDLVRTDHMEPDEVEIMAPPIQLMDSDDIPKYIIHTGDKSDESVGHFLASLQGQVVEVRAEDLEHYTELTPDQISQMAQVAAQVVASQSTSQSSDKVQPETFQIQVEEEKGKPILPHGTIAVSGEQGILQLGPREADATTVLGSNRQGQFVQTFKKVQISSPQTIRQIRSFNPQTDLGNNT